jgi:hypothetical protein
VINVARSEPKACGKILGFEIRHFFENLRGREPSREQVENVTDANTHPANARPAAALFRIDCDSIGKLIHGTKYSSAQTCGSASLRDSA